jgi:hypothetical protein
VDLLSRLLLGNGELKPELRAALESEGLVLIEENLRGTVRYTKFKAPGRRFHGKVTGERVGLGISEARVALYCRSGRTKLLDASLSDPRLEVLDVTLDGEAVSFRIDYDRAQLPKVSGVITIRVKTPNAASIVEQLQRRLGR